MSDDKTTRELKNKREKPAKSVINGEMVLTRKGLPRTGKVKLPETATFLKQPNIVTLMSYDYKSLQIRVLISVIERLQNSIEDTINRKEVEQLALFQDNEHNDRISLLIPIKEFGVTPNLYPKLKECLRELASIYVELDAKDPITGKDSWVVKGLLRAYIPKETHQRTITIEIERDVAKLLVNVDKGWTKFMKEVAISAESKYTTRIYMLISSWKDKGGFSIAIERFRNWLGLDKKYPMYKDLYRWVIRPVYEELFEKADCWFEIAEVYRDGEREPYKLNFKVIKAALSAQEKQWYEGQLKNVEGLCFRYFGMREGDIKDIFAVINFTNITKALNKITYLLENLDEYRKTVTNLTQYTKTAIINDLNIEYDEFDAIETEDALEDEK